MYCMFRFVQCIVTYGSTYVLVALSIDRYDAITHPMNFTGSCKFVSLLKIFFFVTWNSICSFFYF